MPEAEGELEVEPDGLPDYIRRKHVALEGDRLHGHSSVRGRSWPEREKAWSYADDTPKTRTATRPSTTSGPLACARQVVAIRLASVHSPLRMTFIAMFIRTPRI